MATSSICTAAAMVQDILVFIWADVVLMLRGQGQIYCSMQYLHIRHPWRKWQRAVFAQSPLDFGQKKPRRNGVLL